MDDTKYTNVTNKSRLFFERQSVSITTFSILGTDFSQNAATPRWQLIKKIKIKNLPKIWPKKTC